MNEYKVTPESEQENKNGEGESKETENESEDKPEENYRAKLNAQNRFLQKEGYEFKDGKWVKPKATETRTETKSSDDLSSKDLFALMKAQIHEDDVEEVQKASKLLGKSIPDTLKDSTVQSILKTRAEERRTADATNTTTKRAGSKKPSPSELLKNLSEGKVPEKGSAEAEELFWARRGGKK